MPRCINPALQQISKSLIDTLVERTKSIQKDNGVCIFMAAEKNNFNFKVYLKVVEAVVLFSGLNMVLLSKQQQALFPVLHVITHFFEKWMLI